LKPCNVSSVIPKPTKTTNDHQPKRMCLLPSREPVSIGVGFDFDKVISVPVELAESVELFVKRYWAVVSLLQVFLKHFHVQSMLCIQ
jgi:hypothetical protein